MDSVRLSFSIGTSIKVFLYYREWRYANYLLVKTELCKSDKNLNSGQQLLFIDLKHVMKENDRFWTAGNM